MQEGPRLVFLAGAEPTSPATSWPSEAPADTGLRHPLDTKNLVFSGRYSFKPSGWNVSALYKLVCTCVILCGSKLFCM